MRVRQQAQQSVLRNNIIKSCHEIIIKALDPQELIQIQSGKAEIRSNSRKGLNQNKASSKARTSLPFLLPSFY